MASKIPYSRRPPPALKVNGNRDELYRRFKRDKEANAFYHSRAWLRLKPIKLAQDPYCQDCLSSTSRVSGDCAPCARARDPPALGARHGQPPQRVQGMP